MELRVGVNAYHMTQEQRLRSNQNSTPVESLKRLEEKRTAFSPTARAQWFLFLALSFPSTVWGVMGGVSFLVPFSLAKPTAGA